MQKFVPIEVVSDSIWVRSGGGLERECSILNEHPAEGGALLVGEIGGEAAKAVHVLVARSERRH